MPPVNICVVVEGGVVVKNDGGGLMISTSSSLPMAMAVLISMRMIVKSFIIDGDGDWRGIE